MAAVNKTSTEMASSQALLTAFQANFKFSFFTLAQPMQSVVFGMTVMYACDRLNKGRCE
jgi:hypothetical protein